MNRRTPWQHLLRHLLPSRGRSGPPVPDFTDTRPDGPHAAALPALRQVPPLQRPATGWAESAIDLAAGTEIMEYQEDTAADLMDEFFAKSEKRAA